MAHLLIIGEGVNTSRFDIGADEIAIGGDAANNIALDKGLTSCHCRLVRAGQEYKIRSLGSDGRVKVNGRSVEGASLRHGDIVAVGGVELVFCDSENEARDVAISARSDAFTPAPPVRGFVDRLAWPFTVVGRVRRRLDLAFRFPGDAPRTMAVAEAAARLRAKAGRRSPAADEMTADLFVYLTWKEISVGNLQKASQWLKALDEDFPSSPKRAVLRWDLIKALWRAKDIQGYVAEAAALVADSQVIGVAWVDVVLDIVSRSYEQISSTVARDVLSKAHPGLRTIPQIEAALTLCQCPAAFASVEDARQWADRIRPDALEFSLIAKADACLVMARAGEWAGNGDVMGKWALQALRIAPAHPAALYWLCRARLHLKDARPDGHLGLTWPSASSDWVRLRLFVELHERPSIITVSPMTDVIENKHGPLTGPEEVLAIDLIKRALIGKELSATQDLEVAAQVCHGIHARAGSLPWVEVHLARKELLLDRQYETAYRRLEQKHVTDEPGAEELARVARILAGSPKSPSLSAGTLTTIESILHRVLGPRKGDEGTNELEAMRQDPVFARFPALEDVLSVLTFNLGISGGEGAMLPGSSKYRPEGTSPLWVQWLYARTILLLTRDWEAAALLQARDAPPEIAWFFDCWAWNHARKNTLPPPLVERTTSLLSAWVANQPRATQRPLAVLREARSACYRGFEAVSGASAPLSVFPNLGELGDAMSAAEIAFELRYTAARSKLAANQPSMAAKEFGVLEGEAAGAGALAAAWWVPTFRYWSGVAQAHLHDKKAEETLKTLLGGSKDAETRSQLALLSLRDGYVDEADRWLAQAPLDVPCVRYARSLVCARRGELDLLHEHLQSDEARLVLSGTPYAVASRRLLAAANERSGRREEAERLHAELLQSHPTDAITLVRCGRQKLRSAYARLEQGLELDPETLLAGHGNGFRFPVGAVGWSRPFALLEEILLSRPAELPLRPAQISGVAATPKLALPWLQVIACRLRSFDRLDDALKILDSSTIASGPRWFDRTRAILRTWKTLERLGIDQKPDRLQQCLQAMVAINIGGDPDPVSRHWEWLAAKAVAMVVGKPDESDMADWPDLGSHPFRHVPILWSAGTEQRQAASQALRPLLESESNPWGEPQRLLLKALTAWSMGDDEDYLQNYATLEPALDELPVSGPQLWVAAALIRFARKDWRHLLEGEMPECVADLAEPNVRLLIGL
jgi:tetratricopeptide (TPR) repeat protein